MANLMQGARLSFCVRECKDTKPRIVCKVTSVGTVTRQVHKNSDISYYVYVPNGQVYHLTGEELVRYGFDKKPTIMNFDKVRDPDTPAGRVKFGESDKERKQGMKELEDELIRFCTKRTGPIVLGSPEQYDDMEVVDDKAAA